MNNYHLWTNGHFLGVPGMVVVHGFNCSWKTKLSNKEYPIKFKLNLCFKYFLDDQIAKVLKEENIFKLLCY